MNWEASLVACSTCSLSAQHLLVEHNNTARHRDTESRHRHISVTRILYFRDHAARRTQQITDPTPVPEGPSTDTSRRV